MIASVRCADGVHAVIGDHVSTNDSQQGELIGIAGSITLVRIPGYLTPRVIDAGELRKCLIPMPTSTSARSVD